MILVKSLIVLFIALLIARYYMPVIDFSARKVFDKREGFTQPEQLKYTTASPLKKQDQMDSDAILISELKEKMTDLLQLNEKTTEINNNIKKIKN